jgi:ferredoxin
MIYYFSGNGNSQWVAEQIATLTGENIGNLAEYIRTDTIPEGMGNDETLGFVFPIHSWYAPRPVVDFLSKLHIPKETYKYVVCTCGDDSGKCMTRLHRHYPFDAAWSVRMPNTYIPMFELDSDTVARKKVEEARETIDMIVRDIKERRKRRFVFEGAFPWTKTYIINPLFVHFVISAKGFHSDDSCIACGNCRTACPMGNITLTDGHPVWGEHCIHCMACIHSCPQRAIQYKEVTRKKGRYQLKRYL